MRSVDISDFLEEFVAEGEDEMFLHFFPIGLNENAAICRQSEDFYVTDQIAKETFLIIMKWFDESDQFRVDDLIGLPSHRDSRLQVISVIPL